MSADILYDVGDGIATITLNRPETLNAVSGTMNDDLIAAFDRADADDNVRVVIVTGAGRAFCAGADLSRGDSTFASADTPTSVRRDKGGVATLRIMHSLKPVIAAVNGAAVGFGASLMLPADFRIISETAKIGFVFGARGIVTDGAASWFLPQVVGLPRALDWGLTARIFGADEALEAGLATRVVSADEVLGAAIELAETIVHNTAPLSTVLIKRLIWGGAGQAHPMPAHRIESRAIPFTGASADAKEGVRAFLDKRRANWSLRPSEHLPDWFPWAAEPPFEIDGEA